MLWLGHLGVGSRIVSPLTRGLPGGWVFLGCLVPDLIDKPLYYFLFFLTGKSGADLGLVSCTRTFAHTGLFLGFLLLVGILSRSVRLLALALGVLSHLMLDCLLDRMILLPGQTSSALIALLYPFYQSHFAVMPTQTVHGHWSLALHPYNIAFEVVGFTLLLWEYWLSQNENGILRQVRMRRHEKKRFRKIARAAFESNETSESVRDPSNLP